MSACADPATILIVESDVMLGQVLSRALAREGITLVHAVNAAQALALAQRHSPRLVLLDCHMRDANPLELADQLHRRFADLPVIAITDDPLCGQEDAARVSCFARVLSKAVALPDLRLAVDTALSDEGCVAGAGVFGSPGDLSNTGASKTQPRPPSPPAVTKPPLAFSRRLVAFAEELSMNVFRSKFFKAAAFIVVSLVVLAGFAMAMGAVRVPWQEARAEKAEAPPPRPAKLGVELVEGQPHTLLVPEEVREALGIKKGRRDLIVEVKKPTQTRPLVMPGSTLLDPTRLYRIRARFAASPSCAEVVQIAQVPEDPTHSGKAGTAFREIRSGDRVKKGDLLAVFSSVDVGNTKNNLIDALFQKSLDDEILKKAEAKAEAVPEVFILNARRAVQGDVNAINRAVNTLKTWGVSDLDIQAARDEAENVKKRKGEHDKEKDALWARVEVRAPDDGIIVERNLALHEIVADNTTNLFQIAKVDRLAVFANCPEDDVPALEALPTAQRRWTVQTVGSPPVKGFIDDISYLIDPNQHTAVVKGHIDNPKGILRGGQFISATVELPPPADVVELPMDAVIDDGQQSVVMVQIDPKDHPEFFTMRRVKVTHRFDRIAFVRSKPFAKSEQRTPEEEELGLLPRAPLLPGERVLRTGVGELKAALLDKESEAGKEKKQGKSK